MGTWGHPSLASPQKMIRSFDNEKVMESTSFIEGPAKTYKDHPPILISDNEEFSDITQLLENEDDDDTLNNYWYRNKTREVKCCQKEVSLKSVTVLVISLLIFLVICVLIYSQTLSAEKELDLAENPVDSLDIIMAGEN